MPTPKVLPTIVKKEMGITHKEFYGEIPALLEGIPYDQGKDTIKFQLDHKNVEITIGPQGARHLGQSVTMPITPVTLCFFDFTNDEVSRFIKHFNLKYMKGGG